MALLNVNKSAQVLFLKPSTDPNHPWTVLCYDPKMRDDKWVVWFANDAGNTIIGGYYPTLEQARADFDSRAEDAPVISN